MQKELQATELILYFTLGDAKTPFTEDDPRLFIHSAAYDRIENILEASGVKHIEGWEEKDPTVSEDYRFYPYELCADDFLFTDGAPEVCISFYREGSGEFAEATARALRDFCLGAYRDLADDVPVQFARAERYERWDVRETKPWPSLG